MPIRSVQDSVHLACVAVQVLDPPLLALIPVVPVVPVVPVELAAPHTAANHSTSCQ